MRRSACAIHRGPIVPFEYSHVPKTRSRLDMEGALAAVPERDRGCSCCASGRSRGRSSQEELPTSVSRPLPKKEDHNWQVVVGFE